ncbi:MAG: TIGR00730 family Rossman fold protein [Rhodospirillaceae bacterium]|nr:TIGR00730 family Rossman fold protein [Rhodospirillaceae bacterium]
MPLNAPKLTSLCVFCGSQKGADPAYAAAATTLGRALAGHGTTLVFGGGRVGLMGAAADAALASGGKVVGVIPDFLKDKELAHPGATEMLVVPNMHVRKKTMFERSDAFCILPGGVGTMDELFEIITWRQLHLHNKPIIIVNVTGYWSQLLTLLDRMIAEGFAHPGHDALVTVVDRAESVIGAAEAELAAPKPPVLFKV